MKTINLTDKQLHMLQHSLGVDQYGEGRQYRNSYVTDADGADGQECQLLVEAGLMETHGALKLAGGMHYYRVTSQGIDAVALQSPAPPKLTRGQKRYRKFLDADCDLSFGEWLQHGLYRQHEKRHI